MLARTPKNVLIVFLTWNPLEPPINHHREKFEPIAPIPYLLFRYATHKCNSHSVGPSHPPDDSLAQHSTLQIGDTDSPPNNAIPTNTKI